MRRTQLERACAEARRALIGKFGAHLNEHLDCENDFTETIHNAIVRIHTLTDYCHNDTTMTLHYTNTHTQRQHKLTQSRWR